MRMEKGEIVRQDATPYSEQENLAPIFNKSGHFVNATDMEVIGGHRQEIRVSQEESERKTYNYNNGTLAMVDENGTRWVGRATREAYKALQTAGYTENGNLQVPHSNDAGTWMRQHARFRS